MAWAPDYVEPAELAAFVRIADGDDDAQLGLAIATASRAIDRATRRQFGLVAAPETRTYTARRDPARRRWVVPIDDLMTAEGLVVSVATADDEPAVITAYTARPVNAAVEGRPWTSLLLGSGAVQPTADAPEVQVLARWGWTAVPPAVTQACLLQASRLLSRRDAPFGVAGSPEAGSEVRLLAKVDPDVEVALGDYRRRKVWAFA